MTTESTPTRGDIAAFSQAIPRPWVHKSSIAEVFLTAISRGDDDAVTVLAQIPRMHPFFHDVAGPGRDSYDALLLMEAFRQGCLALSHVCFDAPIDSRFVVRAYDFEVLRPEYLGVGEFPAEITMRYVPSQRFTRGDAVTGLVVDATLRIGELDVMTARASYNWMSPAVWDAMRGEAPYAPDIVEAPTNPAAVQRYNPANVVIGEVRRNGNSTRARVVADVNHPVMFDHPLDHLSGNLLLESVRQLAVASSARISASNILVAMTSEFIGFAEFTSPVEAVITSGVGGDLTVTGSVEQEGVPVAQVRMTFAPPRA